MSDIKRLSHLLALLRTGFAPDSDGELAPLLRGSAHPTGTGWIASRALLAQREALSSDNEIVLALAGLQAEWRLPWLRILAARCKEAGQMADGALLVDLISQLHGAALWVEEQLPYATLAASPTADLERECLGVSVEQAAATPMLTRILAACFAMHESQNQPLPALPALDLSGLQVGQNWQAGRLLALPGCMAARDFVLAGAGELEAGAGAMAWLLANPWALLLAMVVYAQDAWAAEARGGLLLELPSGQNAFQPGAVSVLVLGPEGDETRCGTLAGLLLRVLAHLGMACFPRQPSVDELDAQVAPLIGQLLQRQAWRFRDGASGSEGQYQIHPAFADECYKIAGSKVFNRTGKPLWQAVRIQAGQCRSELRPTRQ